MLLDFSQSGSDDNNLENGAAGTWSDGLWRGIGRQRCWPTSLSDIRHSVPEGPCLLFATLGPRLPAASSSLHVRSHQGGHLLSTAAYLIIY